MSQLPPDLQKIRDAHPDEHSPRLRINRADTAVVEALTELGSRMARKHQSSGIFRAPEVRYEFADAHGPAIIAALLEHGEVNLWAMSRQSPGYPQSGVQGFNDAVTMIVDIDGVEVIQL